MRAQLQGANYAKKQFQPVYVAMQMETIDLNQ
jgi:hypothetical protein